MTRWIAIAALALAACTHDHATDDTGEDMDGTMSDAGLYLVHVTPSTESPVAGESFTLQLHVHDAAQDDVTVPGATLTVTPTMPSMGHGIAEPPDITEGADGLYTAEWVFSMGGEWEVAVDIASDLGDDGFTLTYQVQ